MIGGTLHKKSGALDLLTRGHLREGRVYLLVRFHASSLEKQYDAYCDKRDTREERDRTLPIKPRYQTIGTTGGRTSRAITPKTEKERKCSDDNEREP
jgi:hypothetical protein